MPGDARLDGDRREEPSNRRAHHAARHHVVTSQVQPRDRRVRREPILAEAGCRPRRRLNVDSASKRESFSSARANPLGLTGCVCEAVGVRGAEVVLRTERCAELAEEHLTHQLRELSKHRRLNQQSQTQQTELSLCFCLARLLQHRRHGVGRGLRTRRRLVSSAFRAS